MIKEGLRTFFFSYTALGDLMEEELEKIKKQMKNKRAQPTKTTRLPSRTSHRLIWIISKFLITVILTLGLMIGLKGNKTFKSNFYKQVYETNFSFATVNEYYEKWFGSPLPFQNLWKQKEKPVFAETLKYSESKDYHDGVALSVGENYMIPSLEGGLVIFIGEKENYGNTVIVQQSNGIDVWYGNTQNITVKLYDYVKTGDLLGETKDQTLYLLFQKDGNNLKYQDYLPTT